MSRKQNDGTRRGSLDELLANLERKELLAALREVGGQRTSAARRLGISRTKLYRRMHALGLFPRRRVSPTAQGASRPGEGPRGGQAEPGSGLADTLARVERREIVSVLQQTHGQRTLAAHNLGISRARLYRRMEALDIDPKVITRSGV